MKTLSFVKILPLSLALAATAFALTPSAVRAQTNDPSKPIEHTGGFVVGFDGNFTNSDGTTGTFTYRVTEYSATGSATTYVFTRDADKLTRTEATFTNKNPDGTQTVQTTITDYGAAGAFSSTLTVTKQGHGQFIGQGTYTTPAGVTGTVTSVRTKSKSGQVTSTTYNGPAGATTEVQTEVTGNPATTVKTARVGPGGQAAVVQTRTSSLTPLGSFPIN